ncbi:hypothetical protein [Alteromonas halophila]|uniref:Uncharacterized protein n=1 Tax=Alteromonas halophila TaxID=516698 RepID=A0A918JP21_9ALTE|nr:hypothetical protein [Alteromonas halophila]GGW89413.1 hypothetical protein GCM10007391_24580 [Alteromonas halophila]
MKKAVGVTLIIVMIALLLWPDQKSTQSYLINFIEHENHFYDLQNIACEKYLKKKGYYKEVPENVQDPSLRGGLEKIGARNIFVKQVDQGCTIELKMAGTGFAGSGYSYQYRFNPESRSNGISSVNAESFTSDDFTYDIKLSGNWYFTFKKT